MEFDFTIAGQVLTLARAYHGDPAQGRAAPGFLDRTLRLLLRARAKPLADRLIARHGARVLTGPFAGLEFTGDQAEGALAPKLLGTYEAELHPALRRLAAQGVARVIDVGCAEGYYAVGLARLMPQARVEAFDIDAKARARCAELAARNGVADRVAVGERWSLDVAGEVGPGTLVFMDAEGAEAELLGPEAPAALARADLIVETHPNKVRGVTEGLAARFASTHEVEVVFEAMKPPPEGAFGGRLLALDAFAATWEWRATPTPWLVMRPRG